MKPLLQYPANTAYKMQPLRHTKAVAKKAGTSMAVKILTLHKKT